MTISALWPLCLLPLIFVIIIFYLLKQPAKEKVLSSLSYWQSIYKQQHSEKPWEKLRQDLLMYLQIFTILFLILSLCGPILSSAKKKEKMIMIIDTSASMQTLYSTDGTTRLEQAKKEAKKLIESSKNPLEVTIISCSNQPKIIVNSSSDKKRIFSALDRIEQQDCSGSLNYATSLCESIYSQQNSGNCIFFTDSSLHTGSLPAQIYDLSTSTANPDDPLLCSNLYIAYLEATISEDKTSITMEATIGNDGSIPLSSDINFYLNDTLVDVQNYRHNQIYSVRSKVIPLPEDLSYPIIAKAEIQENDALPADNIIYKIVDDTQKESSPVRILLATKQNSFLERALSSYNNSIESTLSSYNGFTDNAIEIYRISSMEDYDPKETYHLSIFDGIFPEKLPKTGSVFLLPNSKHMKASGNTFQELLPEFTYHNVVKNQYINLHNFTDGNDFNEIAFPAAKMLSMEMPVTAEPIFSLSNGNSCGYIEQHNHRFFIVFGFDLHDSTLPLQTEFPIMTYHLLQKCLYQSDFFPNSNQYILPGDVITISPIEAGKKISIRNLEGKEIKSLTPTSSLSTTTTLDKTGIYDFYTKSEDYHAYLSISFPPEESRILDKPEFSSDTKKTTTAKTKVSSGIPIQKLLIVLSILLLIAEFIIWIRRQWNHFHRLLFLSMRTFLILLLCLSLLDISVALGKSTETTLFLVDVSDSMKRDLSSIQASLEQAAQDLPSRSKAGLVAFGADSRVEQFISYQFPFHRLETTPITSATNLEDALRTATYMFSNEDSKRIVLLTDGQENVGTAKSMASALNENGISLKVLKYPKNDKEVLISNVRIPEKLSVGDTFQVEVTVLSNTDTDALLSLYSGETLRDTKQVSLSSGTNRFLFQDTLTKEGINSYRVLIEAENDTETLNNEYVTFTQADRKLQLLLIEGREGEAAEFEKVLRAGYFSYKKILPSSAPQKLLSLKKYAVVILENVHADDLPEQFRKLLQSYVTEGGGLIATGGDNSFALGNYQNSSLDHILPVKSVLPANEKIPETAMALLIDHSGSMEGDNTGITRLSLAKEAAISALSSLRQTDSIGVLAFDDTYDWVVPFTKASDPEKISPDILSIQGGGGTSIYPAVAEAIKQLSDYNAKQKHIVLLTDGEDSFKDYGELYKIMEKEKITLSTVAVSDGADTKLLESMAKHGRGRYYYTDVSTDIPRIFAQEVFLSSDSYLVNKKFNPVCSGIPLLSSDPQQMLETFTKPLYGYIRTDLSQDSFAIIESSDSHESDPILAVRNLGLGVTVAFTSDVTNEWTKNYAGLHTYAQFWKNLINACILIDNDSSNNVSVTARNNIAHISYNIFNSSVYDYIERTIIATCTDENGNSVEAKLSQSKDPESFYIYEADIPLEHTGVYSLTINDNGTYVSSSVTVKGEEVPIKTDSFSSSSSCVFASTYSMEYQLYDDDSSINDLISLTNAELISSADDFYKGKLIRHSSNHNITPYLLLLVLLLFIIDVYFRRFGIPDFLRSLPMQKIKMQIKKKKTKKYKDRKNMEKYEIQKENNIKENNDMQKQSNTLEENKVQEKEKMQEEEQIQKRKEKGSTYKDKEKKKKSTPELLDTSMLLSRKQKDHK